MEIRQKAQGEKMEKQESKETIKVYAVSNWSFEMNPLAAEKVFTDKTVAEAYCNAWNDLRFVVPYGCDEDISKEYDDYPPECAVHEVEVSGDQLRILDDEQSSIYVITRGDCWEDHYLPANGIFADKAVAESFCKEINEKEYAALQKANEAAEDDEERYYNNQSFEEFLLNEMFVRTYKGNRLLFEGYYDDHNEPVVEIVAIPASNASFEPTIWTEGEKPKMCKRFSVYATDEYDAYTDALELFSKEESAMVVLA